MVTNGLLLSLGNGQLFQPPLIVLFNLCSFMWGACWHFIWDVLGHARYSYGLANV